MSPSAIRNCLQRKDPTVFANISRTTISEWIDRSGAHPKWSDNALRMEITNYTQKVVAEVSW